MVENRPTAFTENAKYTGAFDKSHCNAMLRTHVLRT